MNQWEETIMSPKWNYIFGTITITLIVGGTIYAIKKSKDAEKEEEEAISLDEAREMVRRQRESEEVKITNGPDNTVHFEMQEVEIITGVDEEKEKLYIAEEEEEEENDEYEDVDENTEGPSLTVEPLNEFNYFEEGIDPKEDKELRHDPNSIEARDQYIRMELSDWEPGHPVYSTLIKMFEIPFIPTNDGDEMLRTQIIDHKVQFFGFISRWVKEVSFADVIFHYARSAEFECGESVQYWIEYFLDFNEFEWDGTSQQFDTLILRLNSHSYFNEERQTFGLFGLTRESMDQAIRIANRNIDRSVTYEIEFNEFLKTCI